MFRCDKMSANALNAVVDDQHTPFEHVLCYTLHSIACVKSWRAM